MNITLETIDSANLALSAKFADIVEINHDLKRTLVSFQANKKTPFYRWFKFKEGYSSSLVEYILRRLHIDQGQLIDPFAGSGTSLFVATEHGIDSVGIELLPIGQEIVEVRKIIQNTDIPSLLGVLHKWIDIKPWLQETKCAALNYLTITRGAYPKNTEAFIGRYVKATENETNECHRRILSFALLCILEEISYTRKDGQYLRWDYRSGRGEGKNEFNKGEIKEFNAAITTKLTQMADDITGDNGTLFDLSFPSLNKGNVIIQAGSCLNILKDIHNDSFDILITSPPYCNRYDYTRTYALELALLGVGEKEIRELRQAMMSCTVENKDKDNLDTMFSKGLYQKAKYAFDAQGQLQNILAYLEQKKETKELNNPGISRMVKNYFFELSLIIFESARVLKKGAPLVMVNDNVRYAGANIPVDLILSDIARSADLHIEKIWVLPTGKGNSSQQMGVHGREELRKCVYIWRKL